MLHYFYFMGFTGGTMVKNLPGSGRSPGVGNGNLLQCFCLRNSVDRGAWQAIVDRTAKSRRMGQN